MAEKKKILYVVEAMGGGVFTYIVELANALSDKYEVYIAYATRKQTPQNYKEYFKDSVHLIEVKNFTRSVKSTQDLKAFFEIKKIARKIKPDVIHLHSSKAGALGRWAFNGRKIPLFYTPHGYSFLMKSVNKKKRFIFKMIERFCALRDCVTISCSRGEHKETKKMTSKAIYIDNGINTKSLQKMLVKVAREENKKFTVFTLGRICYQKNPKLFNEVAKKLPDVRFVWIGDGELREELTADNIEITGWVNRRKALSYAVSADAFVLTSLWEGLPISLLEAMYMKKPCVVSDVIGNHDVIHNGENGFVCNEVQEFVKAIYKCQKNINEEYSKNAFQDVLKKYNTKVMAGKYAKIYRGGVQNNLILLVYLLLYRINYTGIVTGKAVA